MGLNWITITGDACSEAGQALIDRASTLAVTLVETLHCSEPTPRSTGFILAYTPDGQDHLVLHHGNLEVLQGAVDHFSALGALAMVVVTGQMLDLADRPEPVSVRARPYLAVHLTEIGGNYAVDFLELNRDSDLQFTVGNTIRVTQASRLSFPYRPPQLQVDRRGLSGHLLN